VEAMDDGPGPQEVRALLRRLPYGKRFRVRLAAGFGIRLYAPDEAAAAIAVARRDLRRSLWLNCLLLYAIFIPIWAAATSGFHNGRTLARVIGIVFLVVYFGLWVVYNRWLWRRAVERNLETLRNTSGSGDI
jgi:hypothetical protein